MSIKCGNCGHDNTNAIAGNTCEICNNILGFLGQEAQPTWKSREMPLRQEQPADLQAGFSFSSLMWKIQTLGLRSCEGAVINIQPLPDDKPDPQTSLILLKTLLFLDVFLILGSLGLIMLGASMLIIIIGLIFSIGCILPATAILGQMFIFAAIKILAGITGKKEQLLPVSNYILQTTGGKIVTTRIKGRLRGAAPQKSDHVKFWGIFRHGIIHFRLGLNENTGEPYLLPNGYASIWLSALIILNLIFGFWVYFRFIGN